MKKVIAVILLCLNTACVETKKETNEVSWAGKMQATAKDFQQLLPYIYNEDQFGADENKNKIESKINRFKKTIHQIKKSKTKELLGDDPHALQSLANLKDLTSRAHESFKQGDLKTARFLLKATTNACFKCHTRQNLGPHSVRWSNFNVDSIKTTTIEKVHLLVSMRQYEKAKSKLSDFLKDREYEKNFDVKYEVALRYYVMISLRGQKQWQTSLNFLRSKSMVSGIPTRLHFTIKHWLQDLDRWIQNKKRVKLDIKAAKLVLKDNRGRDDDRNLINNLIASQILHDNQSTQPSHLEKAKVYFLLGGIYDQLISVGYWDLPETYYESCIRYAPNTSVARQCFKKFKDNITLGYSGSRGTFIPVDEYKRIEKLRKISGLK